MRMFFVFLALGVAGCNPESFPTFDIADIVITEPMPGRSMSAGFMTMTNNTDETVSITSVSSPDYGMVEIHESSIEDGVAKMRQIDALEIAPGSTVTLERGGLHLMLMRAKGNPDSVTLRFYDGDTLVVDVVANVTRREN